MDDTSKPAKKSPRLGSASRQTDQAMERAMAKAGKSAKAHRSAKRSERPTGRSPAGENDAERSSREPASTRRERPAPKARDGSELEGLPDEQAYQLVLNYAGRLLSIKDWSQSGMGERLRERFKKSPLATDLAARVAERMREIGALDDARFARGFIRQRLGRKSLAQATREASQKGISREVAQEAIESLREEGLIAAPMDQAYEVWSKKFGELPTDDRSRAKQARFMASRGFSYEALSKAWTRAKREQDE